MTLICEETKQECEFGTNLYALCINEFPTEYFALNEETVSKIPRTVWRIKENPKGFNIYAACSTCNFNNSYSLFNFTKCEFLFSISQNAGKKYLPNSYRKMMREKNAKKKDAKKLSEIMDKW